MKSPPQSQIHREADIEWRSLATTKTKRADFSVRPLVET
jgi:hypothetical protein